jgi:hypothetical protein
VILPAEEHQIRRIRAVVAYVAKRNSTQGEARAGLLVAGTFVPVVAHVDKRKLLETHVWPIEFLLLRLGRLLVVFFGEG